ncbi:hypothetical protein ACHQM5_004607 [Ranunculus cassubicifolius]
MPALKMKTKTSITCSREGGLSVCQKSSKISKNCCSQVRVSQQAEDLQSNQEFSSKDELSFCGNECDKVLDRDLFDGEIDHCQSPPLSGFSSSSDILEFLPDTYSSDFETIFSPLSESIGYHGKGGLHNYTAENNYVDLARTEPNFDDEEDEDNGSRSSSDDQTCNVSDFHISDMIVSSLPFEGSEDYNEILEVDPFPNHDCLDHDIIFDMSGRYMILPFLEENLDINNAHEGESCELSTMSSDDACLYLAIQQMNSCVQQEPDVSCHPSDRDEVDSSDPHMFLRNVSDLSDMVPGLCPTLLPKETRKRKLVNLVLDLDETLVHSTLEHCIDADFTFPVFFNMKEHTVYVRRRPHLQTFLEKVAQMFEITIFTASQSAYAEKLLNILDPESKLISKRAYRESCIFADGTYTKDLTVLGVDLAKVAIIDNSPQVFRLQVNNGIPIKSWFDDPSDCALISLLPFLETLVDADDVRPIIAKRFNNKE